MWKQALFLIVIVCIANVQAMSSQEYHRPSASILQAIQVFLQKQDLSSDQLTEVKNLLGSLKQEYLDYQSKAIESLNAINDQCVSDVNQFGCRSLSEWEFNAKELSKGVDDINVNKLPALNSTLQSYNDEVARQQGFIDTENKQLKEKKDDLQLEIEVVQKAINMIATYYKIPVFVQLYSKLNKALDSDDSSSFLEVAKKLDDEYNHVQEKTLVGQFLKGSQNKNSQFFAKVKSLTALLEKKAKESSGYEKANQIETAQHVVNVLKKLTETIQAAIASEEKESKETIEVYEKTISNLNAKIEEVKTNIAEYVASVGKNQEEMLSLQAKITACFGKPKTIEGDCAAFADKMSNIKIEVNDIVQQIDEILGELNKILSAPSSSSN